MRVKMSKQPPPAPTASAVGPCPTVILIVGRPGTGSLPKVKFVIVDNITATPVQVRDIMIDVLAKICKKI